MELERRPRTRGDATLGAVATLTRVLAVTEEGTRGDEVLGALGGRHWPEVHLHEIDRAHRHLAAKGAAMVIVAGSSLPWLSRAVHLCRQAGRFPIAAIVGNADEAGRALLDEGATLVLDASTSATDLVPRLLALGRGTSNEAEIEVRWLESEGLRLDLASRRCYLGEDTVALSANEFDLLRYLMLHAGEAVPSGRITDDLWNIPDASGLNTLRLNVKRLRAKLDDDPHTPRWIESIRGVGYQFAGRVAEVGKDRSEERLRSTVAMLNAQHDAMYDLVDMLRSASTADEVASVVVGWAVERAFADASTVFRFDQHGDVRYSSLVASAGMSTRWQRAIAKGHPVDDGFIASAAYLRGDVIQMADMSRPSSRFSVTASMSSAENLRACLIVPLFLEGRIWGDVGFMSKESRAFPPARARYLRSVADLVSIALAASRDEGVSGAEA
ncbi:winged helix-turn-helix domain-containing protein [Demequina sp. NBRC 110054]|uniref:winged helix-turn-helix domain-containing protein n=1 Tax=Demequina sp. NBRC 110054 TaxID=1570343 RepID=UPI0013563E99|nr:winged helix-turn-helix domain-containing protein [Demequina sp. NBRC 110054]